jgi:hypothetical protein
MKFGIQLAALQENSIEISIRFLHRKLAYGIPYGVSMELHRNSSWSFMALHRISRNSMEVYGNLRNIPMELYRNSMELHMPIFYGKILWRFL